MKYNVSHFESHFYKASSTLEKHGRRVKFWLWATYLSLAGIVLCVLTCFVCVIVFAVDESALMFIPKICLPTFFFLLILAMHRHRFWMDKATLQSGLCNVLQSALLDAHAHNASVSTDEAN